MNNANIKFFLMAYNRVNYYTKIIEIQNQVLAIQSQNEDLFLKEIYWQHIYPKWHISYRTFHTYLGVNAKRELKLLKEKQKQQPTLFDYEQ